VGQPGIEIAAVPHFPPFADFLPLSFYVFAFLRAGQGETCSYIEDPGNPDPGFLAVSPRFFAISFFYAGGPPLLDVDSVCISGSRPLGFGSRVAPH